MQLQKEKASSQHLETLNEELEGDLEQWFNIIHTLRAHRAAQEGPPERMPPGALPARGSVQGHSRVLVIDQ